MKSSTLPSIKDPLLLLTVIFFILFVVVAMLVTSQRTVGIDEHYLQLLSSFRSPTLTTVMVAFSVLGNEMVIVVLFVLSLMLFLRKKLFYFHLLVIATISSYIGNILLKTFFQRARPISDPLLVELYYSFPSTHTMVSTVFYLTLAYMIIKSTNSILIRILVSISFLLIVFSVGISRIYLGVHFPSDVLASYLIGVAWFLFILIVSKRMLPQVFVRR